MRGKSEQVLTRQLTQVHCYCVVYSMLQKSDYVLTKRSIEKALKRDSRGVARVYSCIGIGAEETDKVKNIRTITVV